MRRIKVEVDVDGRFKIDRYIPDETEAVKAIEEVMEGFQQFYEDTVGYDFHIY